MFEPAGFFGPRWNLRCFDRLTSASLLPAPLDFASDVVELVLLPPGLSVAKSGGIVYRLRSLLPQRPPILSVEESGGQRQFF